jgi:hypothetical protein
MNREEILTKLCYYDLKNPDNCIDNYNLTKEELNIPQIEGKDYANKDCLCDNCFYGRTKLATELLKYVKE